MLVVPRGMSWDHGPRAKILLDGTKEQNLHRDKAHHPGEEVLFGVGRQEMSMLGGVHDRKTPRGP
jgi:hypothetical protein